MEAPTVSVCTFSRQSHATGRLALSNASNRPLKQASHTHPRCRIAFTGSLDCGSILQFQTSTSTRQFLANHPLFGGSHALHKPLAAYPERSRDVTAAARSDSSDRASSSNQLREQQNAGTRPERNSLGGKSARDTVTSRSFGVLPRDGSKLGNDQKVSRLPRNAPWLPPFPGPQLSVPEAELIAALAGAVAQSQAKLLASVSSSFGDAVTRVQKLIQPSPPGLPPGPSDDSAVRLASDPLAFLDDVARDYPGGIATVRLVGEPVLVISNPELAREVLVTQSDVFIKAGTAFFPGSSLTGNGLLVSDGEVWKRQRRLSNAAFRKAAIQSYATAMAELADDMVGGTWTDSLVGRGGRGGRDGVVQGGVVRDVYGDFNELTMKIVVAALFGGGGLGGAAVEQVGPAISTAFDFFAKRATSMLIIPEWFPTPDNLQYTAAVQRLDGVVYRLIEERRKEMAGWAAPRGTAQGGGDEGKDLLTRLLLARDEDGSGMDDQSLRDELMTLLVAGQETSAILLAWVCVQLAMHPEEQRRAAEEVWEVLGGQSPTHADVPKLKYLEAVIQETLRLMPPAYIVGRCACRDTRLGEWRVPHGTTVLVSPYLLHRDPQQWPRALTFDPSRWLPGGDALPPADNPAYWPFGGGPRNCIGMGFALLEASLVLARILQSYSLSLPAGSPPPVPRAMITLRPAGEVNLLLTPLAPHPPEEKVTGSRSAGTAGPAAAEPAGTAAAAAGTAASPAPAAAAAGVAAAAPTQALPAVAEDAATYGRARSKGLGGKAETTAAST